MPAYLIWDTDMICIPYPDGTDPQEDRRRIATGEYLLEVGLRPDEVK